MSYNRGMSTGPRSRLATALEAPTAGVCLIAPFPQGSPAIRPDAGVKPPWPGADDGRMRYSIRCAGEADPGADETGSGSATDVQEARPELHQPPLYKVVLVNDDYTPMEFVVEVLQTFFYMDRNKATQIMLYVHTRGKGVAGVFTYQIAETKVGQVNEYSRKNQHPLLCMMEEA